MGRVTLGEIGGHSVSLPNEVNLNLGSHGSWWSLNSSQSGASRGVNLGFQGHPANRTRPSNAVILHASGNQPTSTTMRNVWGPTCRSKRSIRYGLAAEQRLVTGDRPTRGRASPTIPSRPGLPTLPVQFRAGVWCGVGCRPTQCGRLVAGELWLFRRTANLRAD